MSASKNNWEMNINISVRVEAQADNPDEAIKQTEKVTNRVKYMIDSMTGVFCTDISLIDEPTKGD